jgi:hypothetical protein
MLDLRLPDHEIHHRKCNVAAAQSSGSIDGSENAGYACAIFPLSVLKGTSVKLGESPPTNNRERAGHKPASFFEY